MATAVGVRVSSLAPRRSKGDFAPAFFFLQHPMLRSFFVLSLGGIDDSTLTKIGAVHGLRYNRFKSRNTCSRTLPGFRRRTVPRGGRSVTAYSRQKLCATYCTLSPRPPLAVNVAARSAVSMESFCTPPVLCNNHSGRDPWPSGLVCIHAPGGIGLDCSSPSHDCPSSGRLLQASNFFFSLFLTFPPPFCRIHCRFRKNCPIVSSW